MRSLIKYASNLKFENEIDVWKATIPFIIPDNLSNQIGNMDYNRWKSTMDIMVEFNVIPIGFDLNKAFYQEQ